MPATFPVLLTLVGIAQAGQAGVAEFDVVSIKRNTSLESNARLSTGTAGDGTFTMVNLPIRSIVMAAAPVAVRDVLGLPAWATTERYDITAKPPVDATSRCGAAMGPGRIVSGGVTMEVLVRSLAGLAGGVVNDRTGLQGAYALIVVDSIERPSEN